MKDVHAAIELRRESNIADQIAPSTTNNRTKPDNRVRLSGNITPAIKQPNNRATKKRQATNNQPIIYNQSTKYRKRTTKTSHQTHQHAN